MAERAKRMAQKFEQARDAAAPACHAAVPAAPHPAVVCALLRALAAGSVGVCVSGVCCAQIGRLERQLMELTDMREKEWIVPLPPVRRLRRAL